MITILLIMFFGVSTLPQSPAPSVRDSLKASAHTQSKQVGARPEVDIRIAHPEYNAIGRVDALLPAGISHGTGVLINECLVLTNRHVIGEAGKEVTFRVGYTGDPNNPFAYTIKGTVVGTGGQGYDDYAHYEDWAIVRLNWSIGNKINQSGVGAIPAIFADVDRVKNCINPEIIGFPNNHREDRITKHSNCPFKVGGGGVFGFSCSIESGESGSPVLCRDTNGVLKIIALARSSEGPNVVGAINLSYEQKEIRIVLNEHGGNCNK